MRDPKSKDLKLNELDKAGLPPWGPGMFFPRAETTSPRRQMSIGGTTIAPGSPDLSMN